MDEQCPVTEPDSKLQPVDPVRNLDVTVKDDEQPERLLEILEQWEEGFFLAGEPSPESLGIDDPLLRAAFLERIEERKRLYESVGLTTKSGSFGADGGEKAQVSADTSSPPTVPSKGSDHVGSAVPAQADPSAFGRYRLIRLVGKGAFGRVYLARDSVLDRLVAIKVPVTKRAAEFIDVKTYRDEARILSQLSHPNIVPVYDVGETSDCPFFVVSKYIDGGDLSTRLALGRPAFAESAELVAVVCDALHYTHTQDLFHRDIKPANILIDSAGVPYLADFGLALKDENFGTGARFVGTVAYSSPEQARGEGHLVDGRSDIFSLGIVFYEMLTCRRPFRGDSHQKILEQIIGSEPRPPRQIDDTIPKELERICLKALSKRAAERYATARDMAEDLRHFLKTASDDDAAQALTSAPAPSFAFTPAEAASTTTWTRSDFSAAPLRIIPKGLGSFDEHDADFFLELLPGPRDREGLPDGLRFWKTRIEATDPDKTFRVGMIYGPSGSGKSSLVKAGLLPLLGKHVTSVYLEATPGETVARLLRGIKKAVPELPAHAGLVDSFLALRRGHYLRPGKKLIVVLDQFEQWLFARRHDQGDELVAALRQCDGEKIQVLCLVRDDFWMAATRFSRSLEIDLVPDQNIAAVDLFEPKHARKVLAAFGRAYEALPPGAGDLAREQHAFLDQAIAGLARDGQVVPVRLALFAEMVKGKPWTPATLRDVGGTEGVGVRFLEETFSSPRSSPRFRYHANAVQSVLKSLLSETSTDIKGRMRSIEELRDVSGYALKPGEFSDLVRILDNDLRLITPVDLESSLDGFVPANLAAGARYYQLTHDYLVRPLRDWIYRKQRETRRGRAELLLAERAGLWNTKPERLHLPSAREWLWIRLLTKRADWTLPQQRMMARARRVHGVRFVGLLAALALLAGFGAACGVYIHTNLLLSSFSSVEVERIPHVLVQLERYPRWIFKRRLRELANQPDADPRLQLGYRLALFHEDPGQVDELFRRLLKGDRDEMVVIRDALVPFRHQISATYRTELLDALFRNADPERFSIFFPLFDKYNAALLGDLQKAVDEPNSAATTEKAKDEIAARRALAAVALVRLGQANRVWHLLYYSPDPRSRSAFIIALHSLGANPGLLADELQNVVKNMSAVPVKDRAEGEKNAYLFDPETSRRRGLILALAAYQPDQVEAPKRASLIALLEDLYRDDPDAGVHSAAELVLVRFGQPELPRLENGLPRPSVEARHRWYATEAGHTMVLLDGPVEFQMGSPLSDRERQKQDVLHRRIIPRRFAIATKEVSVDQFQRYAQEKRGSPHEFNDYFSPQKDGPMISLSWFDAVQYCNWLSDKEGLPRCYLPNGRGEFAEGMRIDLEAVANGGYRLPTHAEWEYACRAGSVTSRYYGFARSLLGQYEWYVNTSGFVARSCGRLLPNELGFFDMLGNVSEWCHDRHPKQLPRWNEVVSDVIIAEVVTDEKRNTCGETYAMVPAGLRSAAHAWYDPTESRPDIGFRPARTIP